MRIQLLAVLLLSVSAVVAQEPATLGENVIQCNGVKMQVEPGQGCPKEPEIGKDPVVGKPLHPIRRALPFGWVLPKQKTIKVKLNPDEPLLSLYKCMDRVGRAGGGFCYAPQGSLKPGKHVHALARRPGTQDGKVWIRPWLCLQDEADPRCAIPR